MADTPQEPGILHPAAAHEHFDYQIHEPKPNLRPFVENFWTITWDLTGEEPYTAKVLPYPSINASITNTEEDVTGVVRKRYDRTLTGRGYVVGARFRPGCFRPFMTEPANTLTDTHRPIHQVLGRSTHQLAQQVADTDNRPERVTLLTDFLEMNLPDIDPVAEETAQLVEHIAANGEITRVSHLCALTGVSTRHLQRRFLDYVGAGPKWVIVRCRLQDAAARAAADDVPDWSAVALELGFTDQAHLTRVFSETIGTPPAAYAARER